MKRPARAALLLLMTACATAPPKPSVSHPIRACVISCKHGWLSRRQHLCRGGEGTYFTDITITGEDPVDGNPSESRWLTGVSSFGVQLEAQQRLKKDGVAETDPGYASKYAALIKQLADEWGDEGRAAYNQQDVVLMPCTQYMEQRRAAREPDKRGQHPGEDPFGNPQP